MQNFKDKLLNYEAVPPKGTWDNISINLDGGDQKVIPLSGLRKKSRFVFYGLTAAASLVIIFLSSLFFERGDKKSDLQTVSSVVKNNDSLSITQTKDSLNNIALAGIIRSNKTSTTPTEKQSGEKKKYITILGPGGQPVKISSKVATLIVSADNDYPPKPVWDKKINKWKQLMLSNTLSPTATNLLDIAELSSMRGDN